jgi:2-amino-4-hydroxy-6-hydroxymethyldihydropteridine diphosphokinase
VYLSLGSNLGDRERNLGRAFELLSEILRDPIMSGIYRTDPLYVKDQPFFLNAAAKGHTLLAPEELIDRIHGIERFLGRNREAETRMGPRTLDIDILLFGNLEISTPSLTIPHPRMTERAFVLVPLLELAPELRDPRNGSPLKGSLPGLRGQGVYSWPPGRYNSGQ